MKYLNKLMFIIFAVIVCLSTTITTVFAQNITTYSPTCILMESQTGTVIYEKNAYDKMYPASTTKIMTAILALENCNLTDIATASHEAVFSVPVGYANANIQVGEELTINELLHVLLIHSANEAANILAEHIAGSVESFSTMMNSKASEIGCKNTHFINPNGVHNTQHYSTAYDLALMGRYAMKNETFRKLVNTTFYTLPATNKYPTNDRVFGTTNELIKKNNSDKIDSYYYEYTTGIKTGYTNAAKSCIVASAKKDNTEYIVVILNAGTTESGLSQRYLDCKNLFNYAFENYKVTTLHEAGSILKTTSIPNASNSTKYLKILIKDEISVLTKNDIDITNLKPTIKIFPDLQAPITENTVIGKITYTIDEKEYSSSLLSGSNVLEVQMLNTYLTILSIIIVLYLLIKLLRSDNKKNKKKKKKNSNKNNYLYW